MHIGMELVRMMQVMAELDGSQTQLCGVVVDSHVINPQMLLVSWRIEQDGFDQVLCEGCRCKPVVKCL